MEGGSLMAKKNQKIESQREGARIFLSIFIFSLISLMLVNPAPVSGKEDPYPDKPINLIIGFSPGGASDLAGKIIADKLSAVLGKPVVSVYKPGAGGVIAASWVRKSPPDGYNILLTVTSMFLPPEAKKLDYSHDDFKFLGVFTRVPYFMAVQEKSRWKNLGDFVQEAKKNPGKLTFGTTGTNVGGYFVAQLFSKTAGISLTLVPFKSCGDAMTGLLGGHIDSYFAVPEEKRLQAHPEFPTFKELGFPVVYGGGHGLAVAKGTPENIVRKLTAALKTAMDRYSKEITEKLKIVDLEATYFGPQDAVREYKRIYEIERGIIKETSGAKK
jgi:tripartite-type tricarboxylate transporter receptor subunit TctC